MVPLVLFLLWYCEIFCILPKMPILAQHIGFTFWKRFFHERFSVADASKDNIPAILFHPGAPLSRRLQLDKPMMEWGRFLCPRTRFTHNLNFFIGEICPGHIILLISPCHRCPEELEMIFCFLPLTLNNNFCFYKSARYRVHIKILAARGPWKFFKEVSIKICHFFWYFLINFSPIKRNGKNYWG